MTLIGFPPPPEEVEAFVVDPDPDAYPQLVDRLLASPHYGERWGRHWLDVVRFAETNGFETNTPRPNAWPYRDYVIEAFNQDKPYDRFILEQLAGDQLGEDRATGFLVGGTYDTVKSPDRGLTLQQRMNELDDMVGTTCTAFLGLTVACARCHDHKFDPITQTDYYRVQAVFAGVQHGERPLRPPDYEDRVRQARDLRGELLPVQSELVRFELLADQGLTLLDDEARLTNSSNAFSPLVEVLVPPSADEKPYASGVERGRLDDPGSEERCLNLGRRYTHWSDGKIAGKDLLAYRPGVVGKHRLWLSWGAGWETRAQDVRYFLDRDGDLATAADREGIARVDQRHFAGGETAPLGAPVWSGFQDAGAHDLNQGSLILLQAGETDEPVSADAIALQAIADEGHSSPALQPVRFRPSVDPALNIERFHPVSAQAIRFTILATNQGEPCLDEIEVLSSGGEAKNVALASNGARPSSSGDYAGAAIHQLTHINDGQYGNSHSWISNESGGGWVQIEFAQTETVSQVVWARDRDREFKDRLPVRYRIEILDPAGVWVEIASSRDRVPFQADPPDVATYTASGMGQEAAAKLEGLLTRKKDLERRISELEEVPLVYAGSFIEPGTTARLHRGDPLQPRELVTPGSLQALALKMNPGDATSEAGRRLAFAKWIADPDNPLTARVLVNRLWHYHFGRGIVASPSEFGNLGTRPSNQELLDGLACRFIESGWSVKAMQRLVLNSETFKQSSAPNPEGMAKDADTVFLWRFPPRRLEAEPIRDSILAISGNLDLAMGGPGYQVFEPNDNYVRVYNPKRSFGPDEWRRMVYQFKPRMQHDETFGIFDCPDAALPTSKRPESTTPLQALNLLNSPFILQQSEIFANRLRREAGPHFRKEIGRAFAVAFGRPPDPEETVAAAGLIREHGLESFCRALFNANELLFLN